jgi:RimJ/RimL family protein N-acetyltransferase
MQCCFGKESNMFARTERLLLRPGWPDDAQALARAIANEKIVRNLASVPWPYKVDDAHHYLASARSPKLPEFLIFARTQRNPELIGGIGLHADPHNRFGSAELGYWPELGYWIAEAHWGRGYATEAGRAVIDLARESLKCRRIVAGYFTDNPASGAVLRKLGFKPTGQVAPRHSVARGTDAPMVHVSAALSVDMDDEGADRMSPVRRMTPTEQLAA